MHLDPSDPQLRALILYKTDPDPLLLDAIRVLQDISDPNYSTVLGMIERLENLQSEF